MNNRTIIMIAMVAVVMIIGHASAAPTFESAEATNDTNIDIVFSEAITATDPITWVDAVTATDITATAGSASGATLSVTVDSLSNTSFTATDLVVAEGTVYNTTGTPNAAISGEAITDGQAPTVTFATLNYSDDNCKLVVTFSETIDASETNATKFHLNNVAETDNVNLSAAPTDTDATTLTFTLTEAQRVAALAISGVDGGDGGAVVLDVDAAGVTDIAGNTNMEDDGNTVTETADTTAPTMSSAARVNNTHITVTMSESVTNLGAADGGFIVAKNGDPETTYAVSDITAGGSANLVVLTVADISGSIAAGVKVTYNATENGTITDMAGNDLATDATGVIVAAWKTSSGGSTGGSNSGGGTYPPGWLGTPTANVTATTASTPSATGTATVAPPGDKVTPAPTKKPDTVATTPAAEGTTAGDAKNGAPGFTAVFVIAGMLAVAYAMMRRRG